MPPSVAQLAQRFAGLLEAERERWLLWLPVAMGGGVAAFFAWPDDPPGWLGWAVVALGAGALWLGRQGLGGLAAGGAILCLGLGFAAADTSTRLHGTIMLSHPPSFATISGRVVMVEHMAEGLRLTIAVAAIDKVLPDRLPRRVRLRLADAAKAPPPGAWVVLNARLMASTSPVAPGSYDFQRQAFFDGVGAVGFVVGTPAVTWDGEGGWRGGFNQAMEQARAFIARRVSSVLADADRPGEPVGGVAGVTGALMHGEQTVVPPAVMQAMRDSGLAHLLSISGLHIALVAGLVMGAIRAVLALIPYIALRWPTKKLAAACGLLAAAAYTLLVGAPVPTIRSTLMTGIALLAIMVDRNPFSMRMIGFAALVVLLLAPESLVGPSFQMSFGAVLSLIAAFEVLNEPLVRLRAGIGPVGRVGLYLVSLALTSVIASVATAPFSVFHFQNIAVYGVIANMIAVPLTGIWIMPLTLIAYLLMPLGWDGPALTALGWGVWIINKTAEITAGLPGAVLTVPAMPVAGLAACVVGGLWLCLWSTRLRYGGIVLLLAGMLSPYLVPKPDILIDAEGKLMAVRTAAGDLSLSSDRAQRFEADTWLRRDGMHREGLQRRLTPQSLWPARGASDDGRLACDSEGCLYRQGGHTVALVRRASALAEDCTTAGVVIAAVSAGHRCRAGLVIDAGALRREGAHALYLDPDGVRVRTANGERGNRLWTR